MMTLQSSCATLPCSLKSCSSNQSAVCVPASRGLTWVVMAAAAVCAFIRAMPMSLLILFGNILQLPSCTRQRRVAKMNYLSLIAGETENLPCPLLHLHRRQSLQLKWLKLRPRFQPCLLMLVIIAKI